MDTSKIDILKSRLVVAITALQSLRQVKGDADLLQEVVEMLKQSVPYGTFLIEISEMTRGGLILSLAPYQGGFCAVEDFCDIVDLMQARVKLVA